jgi:hypothetical protein
MQRFVRGFEGSMVFVNGCHFLPLIDAEGNHQVICAYKVEEIATVAGTKLPPWAREVFPSVHAHMPLMDTEAGPVELLIRLDNTQWLLIHLEDSRIQEDSMRLMKSAFGHLFMIMGGWGTAFYPRDESMRYRGDLTGERIGILPQVSELCGSLPASAPVVIYCLDNSSFCCANSEGQLSAITKQKDGLYHVPGELVVVHEVTLAAAVTNLKRLLVACGNRMVFIITPGPRYHTIPCCCSGDHCTHLRIPESGIKLMQDLARLHLFIARRLSSSSNCSVLPACDLLTGKGNATPEEALAAISSWGAVHGSGSNYTRMALCLVDSHFRKATFDGGGLSVAPTPSPAYQEAPCGFCLFIRVQDGRRDADPRAVQLLAHATLQIASRRPDAHPCVYAGRLPRRPARRRQPLIPERLRIRAGDLGPEEPLSRLHLSTAFYSM